jgi:hypothetical protein
MTEQCKWQHRLYQDTQYFKHDALFYDARLNVISINFDKKRRGFPFRPGLGVDHPSPFSSEVKERVEL